MINKRIVFSDIPLQDINGTARESTAVVPGAVERRVSSSDLDKRDVDIYPSSEKALSRSIERLSQKDSTDTPKIIARKDSIYRGSLHNIPLYNQDTDEYHRQVVITTDQMVAESKKKSFIAKIAEQIDLKLLKDAAFALFAISNFLTSLGFNVPYNFANDLATDANVVKYRRHWVIMSIGIANCFGRVIIGYLADKKWVSDHFHSMISSILC